MSQQISIRCVDDLLENVKTVGITGHVRPDGDCIGSALGLANYIRQNMPQIEVTVYLDKFEEVFRFLNGADSIQNDCDGHTEPYDLFFVLDCGTLDRVAEFVRPYLNKAVKVVNIDHHIDGHDFAHINHFDSESSSTCEFLYEILNPKKVTREVAECLYTGIIHDTGVLKYQSTTKRTMEIAGNLMDLGINFTAIIDDTFFRKTYIQNVVTGKALFESKLYLDGKMIASHIDHKTMVQYNISGKEMGGIIDQLRFTTGVEVAVFTYELSDHSTKISMRSVDRIDVNRICNAFGGGGHFRAAGATTTENVQTVMDKITAMVAEQL